MTAITSTPTWLRASEAWARLMVRLYPSDFRSEMGDAMVETYRDRARDAMHRGGLPALAIVWLNALGDSVRNGVGERLNPGITWRRGGQWGRDAERVFRRLVRSPVFVLSMVGTLTVGLGAFAVVYTVVHQVLVAPLPYTRPDDLYFAFRDYTWVPFERGWLGGTDVATLQKARGPVIEDVVGMRRYTPTMSGAEPGAAEPEQVTVMQTTPNLFSVLGVRPRLGRGFSPEEAGPGRPPVVVLTHGLWQRRFGGDPRAIGREVRIDGNPYTVIGVLGRDFGFVRHASLGTTESADAWVTFDIDLATTNPGGGSYGGLIRGRAGTTPDEVRAAVAKVAREIDVRDFESKGLNLQVVELRPDLVAGIRPALVVLGIAGAFLLVVLAINLATLLLVRAAQREREFAISRALGANHVALVRATLLEGLALGTLGGAMGALVAVWGTRLLVSLAPLDLPRREAIAVDWPVALVVTGIGALMGLLAGAVPATWASRTSLATLLSNTAVRGGGGGHGGMRRAMVVVQVALSLVLLCAGGLVVRSFERLLRVDPGFDPAGVLTLRVPAPSARFPDTTSRNVLHARIVRELASLPGVKMASGGSALPLSGGPDQTGFSFPGAPGNNGDVEHDRPLLDYMTARAGYFETLGIRVLQGRSFGPERPPGMPEAIIDRTVAATFFPAGNAAGSRMRFNNDTLLVVGVVEHARQYGIHEDGRGQVYLRSEYYPFSGLSFVLRTDRAPASLAAEARAAVRRVDPELAVSDVRPMEELVGESLRQQRLSAVLVGGFSLGALLLAAMGLFGVVAGAVSRRHHEIAVRLALGADHRRVMRLVLGEGARLIAVGLLVGLPGVFFAGRLLRGVLIGVSPWDVGTLAAVATGLGAVALFACWLPARRVAGIEPAQSLREG